ncbi:ABC transporter ATP-binding protein [Nocardioides immobilis]|nr:ABC transporter ATP-binding protein [Nocardioides immobilis]
MPTKPETSTMAWPSTEPIVDIRDLSVHYGLRGGSLARLIGSDAGTVKAVDGINLTLRRGEVVGLVGESGSGKSTLGRALLGLAPATEGSIEFEGQDLADLSGRRLRALRRDIQMVFQDPSAALNPAMTVEEAVGDALRVHGMRSASERRTKVIDALERVGLSPVELFLEKYPRDLSGGQKQRVVLARAIITGPSVLVADEPISMLDMSVRAKILQLMLDLKQDLGLTYVYITHDLASAKFFCDRIAIMYLGRVVEIGPTEEIFANPRHPYTKALLRAIPDPDPGRQLPRDLPRGEVPDAASPPFGCAFHPRCNEATPICGWESRDLRALIEGHWTRRSAEEYAGERSIVGDLDHLDKPTTGATIGSAGSAETRVFLDRVRAEKPDEPIWGGIDAINDVGSGVRVQFREGVDPALRRAGEVQVACVLYPDEPTGVEAAESDRDRPPPPPEPVSAGINRRTVGLTVVGLIAALLPFVAFAGITREFVQNGVLTSYSRINVLGILGGVVAFGCGWALLTKGGGAERAPWWKAVGVVVALLGVLQFLHGSSLLVAVSPCQSERVDSTWCR